MAAKLITAPGEQPVTLAEAKLQCRVDGTEEDTLIAALIESATQQAEHITGRVFVTQTWELALDAFPPAEIDLPAIPAQSITSIKYLDETGAEQTITSTDYGLDTYSHQRHWVIPANGYTWPTTLDAANAVKLQYVAGYGTAATVPQGIKTWIKMAVATLYAHREFVAEQATNALPRDFMAGLLDPFKVYRW